ncbi:MAG: YncE family protein [Terriglobales bacterium]
MRILRLFLVPLALAGFALAQTQGTSTNTIASPQPSALPAMQPGAAVPSPEPVTPVVRPAPSTAPEKIEPNVNLRLPTPQRALVRRVAMVEIPGNPGFNGVVFTNGCLVMAHPGASSVDVFNVVKRRVVATLKDMKGASGVAADDKGGRVYVANSDSHEIAVISTKDWKIERRIPLKTSPDALLLVPELGKLYASNWRDQSISIVDLNQGSVADTVVIGGRPEYLVFDPATRQIFTTLEDLRQVAVLDPSLKIVKRFPLVASEPTGLALDAKSRRLYVAVRSAVLALDADSGQELRRVAAPSGIDMLWLDEAGGKLYGAAVGGTIAVFDAAGGKFAADREYNTEVHGHTLAYDPAKKMIFLPGGRDGRSKLLMLRRLDPNEVLSNPQVAKR